jgi:hypothetical protein
MGFGNMTDDEKRHICEDSTYACHQEELKKLRSIIKKKSNIIRKLRQSNKELKARLDRY